MNLRQLGYFCAVAETLNFSRAAAKVGIAQPPLSQQIKALEAELGVELFDRRSPKQIALTAAGRALLPYAHRALNSVTSVAQVAEAINGGGLGSIAVGAGFTALMTIVPDVIRLLEQTNPGLELIIHSLVGREQVSALLDGTIDVGIARGPISHKNLISEPLFHEPFVAALPADHRLIEKAVLTVDDLAGEKLIVTVANPSTHNLSEIALSFFSDQAQLNVKHRVSQLSAAIALVRSGLGVSLVPASLQRIQIAGIAYRPLQGDAPLSTVCLIRNRQTDAQIIDHFVVAARSASQDLVREMRDQPRTGVPAT